MSILVCGYFARIRYEYGIRRYLDYFLEFMDSRARVTSFGNPALLRAKRRYTRVQFVVVIPVGSCRVQGKSRITSYLSCIVRIYVILTFMRMRSALLKKLCASLYALECTRMCLRTSKIAKISRGSMSPDPPSLNDCREAMFYITASPPTLKKKVMYGPELNMCKINHCRTQIDQTFDSVLWLIVCTMVYS